MSMCRSCGEFVPSYLDGGTLAPVPGECPECGGVEFKDTETGDHITAD